MSHRWSEMLQRPRPLRDRLQFDEAWLERVAAQVTDAQVRTALQTIAADIRDAVRLIETALEELRPS